MRNIDQLKDKMEILIITYNRCESLSSTLEALGKSPFRECRITVLDNCSPDETPVVAENFRRSYPDLQYLRNRVNIGGNPNYLKAIELASAEYTWVLCDDDFLDFSSCDDVVDAVVSGVHDLIEVGATERGIWPRGTSTTPQKMLAQGLEYHFRFSFFPAYIFRTSLFDSECFCWGYKHIDRLYPQFEFLNKSVRDDFSVYLARKRIVQRNEVNDHAFSPFAWYASWVACCRTINDKQTRTRAIEDATADRGFFRCVLFWMVFDRKVGDGDYWLRVVEVYRTYSMTQRMKFLLVLPLALLPLPFSFWAWVRTNIYRMMRVPDSAVPPLRMVKRG